MLYSKSCKLSGSRKEKAGQQIWKTYRRAFFLHARWVCHNPASMPEKFAELTVQTIDYRCEEGRFPASEFWVTFSNPDYSSWAGVNPEWKAEKKNTYLIELDVRKLLVVNLCFFNE